MLREASRNVWSPRSPLALVIALAAVLGIALPVVGAVTDCRFREALAALADHGRGVLVFASARAEAPVRIDVDSCTALIDDPAVARVGPIVESPGASIPRFGADVRVLRSSSTLFPDLSRADVLIGSAVPGPAEMSQVTDANGTDLVAIRADPQPEGVRTNSSIVAAMLPDDRVSETCVAVLRPDARISATIDRLRPQLVTSGGELSATEGLRDTLDPVQQYVERAEQFVPLVVGLLGGAVAAVVTAARAGSIATYRLLGARRRTVTLLTSLEHAYVCGVFVAVSVCAVATLHDAMVAPAAAVADVLSGAGIWMLVASNGALPVTMRGTARLARDP